MRDAALLWALGLATLLLHFLVNGRYGYWIDELYFVACGDHLDWGYVDQPPLIAVIARISRWLLGDSLFAIRFFPALAGAGLVVLTGEMARVLGGRRFAQALAAVAVIIAPVYLGFANLLTMNAFEPLFWMLVAYVVMRIVTQRTPQLWLLAGLVAGFGFLNKHSMVFFLVSLSAGLLGTSERRILWSKWVWLGGLLALVIVLPNLLWEARLGWPTIELLQNAKRYQHESVTPLEFLWGQIQLVHPCTLPLWVGGLFFLLRRQDSRFRFLGWTFVVFFAASMLGQAKTYYVAPIYPMLLAAGAVATEHLVERRTWHWPKSAAMGILLVGGVITAPYVLPVLPIEWVPTYLTWLGIKDVRPERREEGQIPQLFADMLGSREMVAAVGRVYGSFSPTDRSRCAIWGRDYGAAGAIDFFGPAYQLPKAISGHQNYYLWGPGDYSGELVITINIPGESLRPWFRQVDLATTVRCPYCMPDRMNVPIYVCRGLKEPLKAFWPEVKCWTCDKPPFAR